MTWYRLAFQPSILDDLGRLDASMAQRLLNKTRWLASNAGNLRHEPVADDLPGICKYAVEEWRIYYSLDQTEHYVDIHGIVRQKPT